MIELPSSCVVDKFIPKKTFYEKVNISNSVKDEFVEKLSKIYWRYKLSEDTINISKTDNVEEIEIFELELKEKYNTKNIIKVITKNIPYPILFYITYNNEFQYAIRYEDDIFYTEWNNEEEFDFSAFNLEILYENIIRTITSIDISKNNLDAEIKKQNDIYKLEEEIRKLESRIRSEKQFNIKVQYNEEIIKIKKMIEELKNNG